MTPRYILHLQCSEQGRSSSLDAETPGALVQATINATCGIDAPRDCSPARPRARQDEEIYTPLKPPSIELFVSLSDNRILLRLLSMNRDPGTRHSPHDKLGSSNASVLIIILSICKGGGESVDGGRGAPDPRS